jgi:hypothetical protein
VDTNASLPFQKVQLSVKRLIKGQKLVIVTTVRAPFTAVCPSHVLGGHLFHFYDNFRHGNCKHFDRGIFDQQESIFFTTSFTQTTITVAILSIKAIMPIKDQSTTLTSRT